MARHIEVIDVALPLEEAFEAIADFARTPEWDPGVVSAMATTAAPLRVGSRFRVEVELLGRRSAYGYAITELEAPSRVVLRGGDGVLQLVDDISFVRRGRATRITWELRCEVTGLRRLADPLIELVLARIARRSGEGLRRWARTQVLRARYKPRARAEGEASSEESRGADPGAKPVPSFRPLKVVANETDAAEPMSRLAR